MNTAVSGSSAMMRFSRAAPVASPARSRNSFSRATAAGRRGAGSRGWSRRSVATPSVQLSVRRKLSASSWSSSAPMEPGSAIRASHSRAALGRSASSSMRAPVRQTRVETGTDASSFTTSHARFRNSRAASTSPRPRSAWAQAAASSRSGFSGSSRRRAAEFGSGFAETAHVGEDEGLQGQRPRRVWNLGQNPAYGGECLVRSPAVGQQGRRPEQGVGLVVRCVQEQRLTGLRQPSRGNGHVHQPVPASGEDVRTGGEDLHRVVQPVEFLQQPPMIRGELCAAAASRPQVGDDDLGFGDPAEAMQDAGLCRLQPGSSARSSAASWMAARAASAISAAGS
jgi:hypothetical protein